MKTVLDKRKIRALMHRQGINTQKKLAQKMSITENQLSVILSNDFSPLKTSTVKLMDILGQDVLDAITIKKQDLSHKKTNVNPAFPDGTIDVTKIKPKSQFNVLELFAGAGGLALGLEEAGFNDVGLLEFDKDACQTLRLNRPNWNVIEEDITKVTSDPKGVYNYIPKGTEIDLLSGGYPCQAFSYAGKKLGMEDTRGTLFYHYAKIMEQVKPKMFLVENVRGLTTHDHGRTLKTMIQVFENLGYKTTYQVLNAWDHGVAEKRERMVLVGIRNDLNITFQYPNKHDYKPVLKDVLQDVPDSAGMLYSEAKRKVMELVPAGGYWRDLPEAVAKSYMGKSYYSGGGRTGMARRISWDEPSLTLTTSPNQKQTERCHPDETRPFTTREYARIQSFPDSWQFSGGVGSIYKQIGNAVAVNFGKEIALAIINSLNQTV
ncbi:DNA (cytosine-5-)-methyltransferase [Oenococcus kitaharae]|nr:DNA (cytosine-5-)-methyltransferase [Oenococcus kitaharae]